MSEAVPGKSRVQLPRLGRTILRFLHLIKESAEPEAAPPVHHKRHGDLLTRFKTQELLNAHEQRMEHYGAEFWRYYYRGERPTKIIRDAGLPLLANGGGDCDSALMYMLRPESAEFVIPTDELEMAEHADIRLSQQRWVNHLHIGETAMEMKDYIVAESNFRMALSEAQVFPSVDTRLSRTLLALAQSLLAQGRGEEAEELQAEAATIEELAAGHHQP